MENIVRQNRIKVLFVLHSSGTGGSERLHVELVENLSSRGIECITVLQPNSHNPIVPLIQKSGGKYKFVDALPWWTNLGVDLRIRQLRKSKSTQDVINLIVSEKADIVITHTGVIPYGAIAAYELGLPHIWYLHEFLDKDHGLPIPLGKLQFTTFVKKYSEEIWTNSKAITNYFFSGESEKIKTIYHFPKIDSAHFVHQRNKHKFTIGVLGNFNGGKNIPLVISACALIKEKIPNFELQLFGWGDSEKVEELKSLAEELSISENVVFRGVVDNVLETYKELDLLVMASKNESFGRTPFEAMQLHIPVVCSHSVATSEYMVDRYNGLLFDPESEVDLSDKIVQIFQSRELAETLIKNSKDYLIEWRNKNVQPELAVRLIQEIIRERTIKQVFRIRSQKIFRSIRIFSKNKLKKLFYRFRLI
jgi:glycosyltransferase involved in cell wall biosynthesis